MESYILKTKGKPLPTISQTLLEFESFWKYFSLVFLVKNDRVVKEYAGEDIEKLKKGRYFDSVSRASYYASGDSIIFFVE